MRIKWYVNTIVIGLFGNQILFWTIQYFDEISHKIENKIGNIRVSAEKIFSIENILNKYFREIMHVVDFKCQWMKWHEVIYPISVYILIVIFWIFFSEKFNQMMLWCDRADNTVQIMWKSRQRKQIHIIAG